MALGALIGAYQEDDAGRLKALAPLAGRTLVEYQARCAAAAGAAPVVVVADQVPPALAAAFERLRTEGIAAVPVSNAREAAARFEAGTPILQFGDGIAPAMTLVQRLAEADGRAVATVPDDGGHRLFERINNDRRWAGLALVDAGTLSSTAAMLGDWDLQSTLLRRTIQAGATMVDAGAGATPYLANSEAGPQFFDRHLLRASRQARRDWASRYLLPPVEEFATERLMGTPVRPSWLMLAALLLTLGAAVAFALGWPRTAVATLLLAAPLDLIAERLATVRLRPLPPALATRRLLWPAAGVALLALGDTRRRTGAAGGRWPRRWRRAPLPRRRGLKPGPAPRRSSIGCSRGDPRSFLRSRSRPAAGGTPCWRCLPSTRPPASSFSSAGYTGSNAIEVALTPIG